MKIRLIIAVITSGLLLTAAAIGQSESVVSSARELAKEGLEAYDTGRYDEAAEKLAKAYQLVPVPTLATNRARALVKLGKWVSASERYLEAIRIPKDKTWQAVQLEAQRDAEREREALMPRIPRLKVLVSGAAGSEVEISIDGVVLPAALIGIEQLQDPGAHKVQGKRGSQVLTETVTAKPGERATVTLRFSAASAVAPQPTVSAQQRPTENAASAQPGQPVGPTQSANASSQRSSPHHQKLIGWIGIGAGGAGILAGGVAGLLALTKQSSLNDSVDCSAELQNCTPAKRSDVDSYNGMRLVSTVGFVAGGVLTAAGVTLLLTAPSHEPGPRVGLWLSPNAASLTGRF